MTRNYTIDCIKLLLSAMIACHHFKGIFISSTTVVHIFLFFPDFFLLRAFIVENTEMTHSAIPAPV